MKLDKEFKDKWITALRSGEYEQGTGALCRDSYTEGKSYCCLGVAASILGIPNNVLEHYSMFNDRFFMENKTEQYRALIPEVLKGDYTSDKAAADYDIIPNTLAQMNDNGDATFEDIADWIEENL